MTGDSGIQGIWETSTDTELFKARLELLYEAAQKSDSYADVSRLIEEILRTTQDMLRASASSLLIVDEGEEELFFQAVRGEVADKISQVRLDLNSGIAGWVVRNGLPAVANDLSGDDRFNKEVDKLTDFETKSLLAVPLKRGQRVIGVLEVLNKVGSKFNDRDLAVLTGFAASEALILLVSMAATALNNVRLQQKLIDRFNTVVATLAITADAKDPYAYGHSKRVKAYALMAAKCFPFTEEELEILEFGALLHDIGKIGINDAIFSRTGPLSFEEEFTVKKHTVKGAAIVRELPYLEKAEPIVLYHHEWYDGKGYPEGLKGEEIPLGARIISVAEAFDTMTTDHSYSTAMKVDEALAELIRAKGKQFCPVAVEAFVSQYRKYQESLNSQML